MKNFPLTFLAAAATFFLVGTAAPLARAQDTDPTTVVPAPTVTTVPTQTQTTTTTTGPDQTKTTQTTVTTAPTVPAPATVPVVPVQPGQHVAEIEVVLTHGTAQAYFGRAPRGEKFSLGGDASFSVKLPSTATVTKLAHRDKTSEGANEITVDNPWHVMVPFSEPGRYVFNLVEWDDDAVAALVLVKVDGVVKFEGHGKDDEIRNWPEAIFGEGVHRTGSREIAFDVD